MIRVPLHPRRLKRKQSTDRLRHSMHGRRPGRRVSRLNELSRGARLHRLERMAREAADSNPGTAAQSDGSTPPPPPLELTPLVACSPETDPEVLEYIAREAPELRRWLVANPRADARLLEYVSQAGGPGVKEALTVLLDSLDEAE